MKRSRWVLGGAVFLLVALFGAWKLSAGAHAAKQSRLVIEYGPAGVQRVVFAGAVLSDLAQDPADGFHIWHMAAATDAGKPLTDGAYGWGENSTAKKWDSSAKTWVYGFPWGTISAHYVQVGEGLNVEVTVENRANSGIVFEGASAYVLTVHLAERPAGFSAGTARLTDNVEEPGVVAAEYGTGTLAVVVPDDGKPLFSGLEPVKGADNTGSAYAVMAGGVKPDSLPEAKTLRPALRPGEIDHYTVSIRFASAGQGAAEIAQDVYQAWAKHWPRDVELAGPEGDRDGVSGELAGGGNGICGTGVEPAAILCGAAGRGCECEVG